MAKWKQQAWQLQGYLEEMKKRSGTKSDEQNAVASPSFTKPDSSVVKYSQDITVIPTSLQPNKMAQKVIIPSTVTEI